MEPPIRHLLSDGSLKDEIQRLGGTPQEVLDDPDLMATLMPVARADLSVIETYVYYEEPPLECPIYALAGTEDPEITRPEAMDWRNHGAAFNFHAFPGGHFFLRSSRTEVMNRMGAAINIAMHKGSKDHEARLIPAIDEY